MTKSDMENLIQSLLYHKQKPALGTKPSDTFFLTVLVHITALAIQIST